MRLWTWKSISLVLFAVIIPASNIQWLGMRRANRMNWDNASVCRTLRRNYGLDSRQTRICKTWRPVMQHISQAATLTVVVCQAVLQNRRWNCSSVRAAPRLTPELVKGTKEQSFVYALSAAAMTYTITRDCAMGKISNCGCGTHPEATDGTFKWRGCDDNIRWGLKFARQFTKSDDMFIKKSNNTYSDTDLSLNANDDMVLREQKALNIINEHNYKIGRKMVMSSVTTHCKCHGMSGSCNVKTCWRGLPNKFIEVGLKLLKHYNKMTVQVSMAQVTRLGLPENVDNSLVYVSDSSDYCDYDLKRGSFGTFGRKCNATAIGYENCFSMCCGRGYTTQIIEHTERCQCKYHWCCYVKCQSCKNLVNHHICN
ncbi:protein Wnt-11b-like [Adelges cooleyi]|uniref:protein Wnt-11b-like n=1 Tax=Adelges cooleyi TaxID=133065 RepID=UPI00217F55ED|nr:protein Wnt-11b-like [Adelges cooleyi]